MPSSLASSLSPAPSPASSLSVSSSAGSIELLLRGAISLNNAGVYLLERGCFQQASKAIHDSATLIDKVCHTITNNNSNSNSDSDNVGSTTSSNHTDELPELRSEYNDLFGLDEKLESSNRSLANPSRSVPDDRCTVTSISNDTDTINICESPLLLDAGESSSRSSTTATATTSSILNAATALSGTDTGQKLLPIRIDTYYTDQRRYFEQGAVDLSLETAITLYNAAVSRVCMASIMHDTAGTQIAVSLRKALRLMCLSRTLLIPTTSNCDNPKQLLFLRLVVLDSIMHVAGLLRQENDEIRTLRREQRDLKQLLRRLGTVEIHRFFVNVAIAA